MVQPRDGTVLFQLQQQLAREETPEPTKGMVVVRGQEGMKKLRWVVLPSGNEDIIKIYLELFGSIFDL